MYPDLSYFFHDVFGTPVDNWLAAFKTFGLFLAVAILSAALLLKLELKRMSRKGVFEPAEERFVVGKPASFQDLGGSFLLGFAFGYKLGYIFSHFAEFQADAAAVLISLKGSWFWGLALGGFWALLNFLEKKSRQLPVPQEETREIYPHHRIGDITIIAALAGIAGAKLFDLIEHLDAFFEDPIGTIFSGGGLAIYGGLILGFVAVVAYLYYNKIPIRPVMDAVAPSLVLGYGIGRLGCHFSGDGDWGIANTAPAPDGWFLPDWLWAFHYPRNVLKEDVPIPGCVGEFCMQLSEPVYPTPIYEVAMAVVVLAILILVRKKLPVAGMLFFVYLILNSITRYSIESIRVNVRYQSFFQFTQAELISIAFLLVGAAGLVYLYIKREKLGQQGKTV